MQAVVAEAIDAGAAGFATSASPTHNGDGGGPVPSRVGDLDELRALLAPLRDAGKGVVALLPADVISHKQVAELQQEVGRPVTWTALLTVKGYPYHEKVVQRNDEARARGVEVWPQVSCRPLVFQMNLAEPFTLNSRQSFSRLMDLSTDDRMAAYRDPAWRASTWEELSGANGGGCPALQLAVGVGGRVDVAAGARGPGRRRAGRRVGMHPPRRHARHLARRQPRDPLLVGAWPTTMPMASPGSCPRDNVLLGLADSGAHVSQLCDACFATDLLGTWVRDRDVMPIEAGRPQAHG